MAGTKITLRGVMLSAAVLGIQFLTPGAPDLAQQPVVRIGDQTVMVIHTGTLVYSVWARARITQTNLDNALISAVRRGMNPIPVTVVTVNGHPQVQVAGYTVAVAGEDTAKAVGKSAEDLAQQWANDIKQALSNNDLVKKYTDQLLAARAQSVSASETYMYIGPAHGKNLRVQFTSPHHSEYSPSYVGIVGGTAEMALGPTGIPKDGTRQDSDETPAVMPGDKH